MINHGQRVEVALPDFTGAAGFQERNGEGSLSYPADRGRPTTAIGAIVDIAGTAWTVTQVAKSQFVKGFRVLTLRKGQ